MPNRILREGILTSERVAALTWAEEVFYRRLMSVVDDFGRFHANVKLLRSACYPLQFDKVSDADIGKWLASCAEAALVSVYPAPDGKRYLQLLDFRQQVRASASKFPPMSGECVADAKQPPDGVSDSVWEDFLRIRKAKRAPMTDTALDGIRSEADKAGLTLQQALMTCCARGWLGFKADWLADTRVTPQTTVPGPKGPDPALEKLKADERNAAPMPAAVREALAGITKQMKVTA